jgi:integrase/recombinase XerD
MRNAGALLVCEGRGKKDRLHRYLASAGIEKPGSVHIFRHTMATLMHRGGADIRDLQTMLGHAQLSTTEIKTHVSIERLKGEA